MHDLISRQAAIDALMPIYKSASLRNRNVFSTARKCMAAIEDLPAAERKKGEWIDLGKDKAIRWQCSECGRKDTHIYNYCPDCGSDNRWC